MIELLETFGNDLTVVNAARVSFHKESTEMTNRDEKLIQYLADHNHNSPFFHPQLRFRIKMPIFVAREWFRHTIGFARNEVSRRYVDTPPELWFPTEFRERDPNLKQGSKDTVVESPAVKETYDQAMRDSLKAYHSLLDQNVAPEIARAVLPLSLYTEFIETGSLAAYARLCKLRLDPHAQKEIQEYAQKINDLIEPVFPIAWKALLKDV
jgi:thymidylate synthase (FAD)